MTIRYISSSVIDHDHSAPQIHIISGDQEIYIRLQGRYRTRTKILSRFGNTSSLSLIWCTDRRTWECSPAFIRRHRSQGNRTSMKKRGNPRYSLVLGVSRSQTMSMHLTLKGLIESLDDTPLKTSGQQQNEFDQTTAKLETRNLNARCYWQYVSNGSRGTAQHFR